MPTRLMTVEPNKVPTIPPPKLVSHRTHFHVVTSYILPPSLRFFPSTLPLSRLQATHGLPDGALSLHLIPRNATTVVGPIS